MFTFGVSTGLCFSVPEKRGIRGQVAGYTEPVPSRRAALPVVMSLDNGI